MRIVIGASTRRVECLLLGATQKKFQNNFQKLKQKCFMEKNALLPKQKAFAFFYMNKWKQRSGRDQTLVGPGISTGVLHHDRFMPNLQKFLQHKAQGLPEMLKSFTSVHCYSRRSLPLLALQIDHRSDFGAL